jgi:hypothetical protein
MKKCKLLLALILFVINVNSFSQSVEKNIQAEFNQYTKYIIDGKFDLALTYLIPEFFDHFPKQELLNGMKQLMQNESIIYKMQMPIINKVYPIIKEGNNYYTLLDFNSVFSIKFKGVDNYSDKELDNYVNYYYQIFKNEFGKDNVIFNSKNRFFEIKGSNFAIATSNNGKTDWKFLQVDPNLEEIYRKIIPNKVVDKFKAIMEK